jgi:hypothetical protein
MQRNPIQQPEIQPGDDWNLPPPKTIPRPTAWPVALAFGSTLLAWGLVSSWILSLAGALVLLFSLRGWIGEIRHERTRK